MRCVVTGAMGFVGLNVTRQMAERGHEVIAIGRQQPDAWVERFLAPVQERVIFRCADVGERGVLGRVLAGEAIDAVIHAAVITATTEQVEREASVEIVAVNVGGTMEALELARAHGARLIYVSSPAAIGDVPHSAQINEDTATTPASIYGITKLASEQIVRRYGAVHEISTVAVRIAQPYGPGERATASRARTSPIQEWLVQAERGETLVTGPLENGRDWTYILDTARGLALLAEAPLLEHPVYHLNRSATVRVGDVIEALRSEYPRLRTDETAGADGLNPNIAGPRRQPLDNRRFRQEFGWVPETGIADGMRQYLDWWREWRAMDGV